jgi:hypothetical protein
MKSGIYIVELLNKEKLCSYNGDPRRQGKGTPVGLGNLKFGKSVDLNRRRKNYIDSFGDENVNFIIVHRTPNIHQIEKLVKSDVTHLRIISVKGRPLEWLQGISSTQLQYLILKQCDDLPSNA